MSRRSPSVGTRVAVAVTMVLAIGVAVLSLAAYWRVAERLDADLDRALLREAEAYSAALKRDVTDGADLRDATRTYLQARSRSFSTVHPVLLVRFADGRVVSNTELRLEDAGGNRPSLEATGARRTFLDIRYRNVDYRAATVPISGPDGTVLAVFEAALPTAPTRELGAQLLFTLAGAGLLVIAIGAVVAVWVARTSLKPLRDAAATASRVSQSTLTERIGYEGADDEVGRMVSSINAMLDRLESAFGEQRRFVADASHELRTPIAVIAGHLEIVRDTELTPAERREEFDLIADETARMGRLVDDLLALARLEAGGPTPHQPLEVGSLLDEAAARGRGLGPRRIIVDAPDSLWVDGDPDQLMQALLNLVGNAIAHTSEGGTIRLEASSSGSLVRIDIEDNGTGIRAADVPRIFDRFYRAQGPRAAAGGGSGLGLAITRRLIELHGGSVRAGNLPTGGAVFTVELPRTVSPEQRTS